MKLLRFLIFFLPFVLITAKPNANRTSGKIIDSGPAILESSQPPLPAEQIDEISKIVDGILRKSRFNGSILVGYRDYILYEQAIGLTRLNAKDSLSVYSPFQLASVSKSFTALSVMLLVDKGLLGLDDKVKEHISELPYKDMTVRQLLNHTSGIPNYMNLAAHHWPKGKAMSNEDMLKLLVKHKLPVHFKAGSRFQYSNTGYALLALLVERLSGISFNQFLKTNIFEPLDMQFTFAYDRKFIDSLVLPVGHRSAHRNSAIFDYDPVDEVIGDKSIFSTPGDLFRYNRAWTSNFLVSDSLLGLAFTKGTLRNHQTVDYGFGWRFREIDGKQAIYHNGLWHGFTATYTRIPETELTIIILNNTNAHVSVIARQIVKELDAFL
jgi:CubicO group peptidase (beta-lactamase class C family)